MVVSMRNVVKRYGEHLALDNATLEVDRAEIFGLLGPNGAGKTTAIRILTGLQSADSGTVSLFGTTPRSTAASVRGASGPDRDARRRIGLAPQEPAIFEDLTTWENLRFFGGLYGLRGAELNRACTEALELSGLEEEKRTYPRAFSGGLKRRLNIACALVHRPDLVILDEPTVGVDPQSRNRILDQVRNLSARGVTVIYASHYLAEVQALCTTVGIMDRGRVIVQGTIHELISRLDSEERIRLVLDRPSPGVTQRLAALKGVLHCRWEEGALVLSAEPGQVRIARVVEAVAHVGVEVIHAEMVRPGLEDLFLAFTGRRLPREGEGAGAGEGEE